MRSPSRGLVLGLGSALAGQAVRGGGLAVVADALLQARRQVGQVARGAGVEGEGLHGARGAGLGAGGRGRGIAVAHEQQVVAAAADALRSEEHTSELQSLMRISYAVFCLKKKKTTEIQQDKSYK